MVGHFKQRFEERKEVLEDE